MEASSSASPRASYGRRNIFYLRVSPHLVLPCILYVDPRHVLWLNTHPSTMPATLKFLKGRIMDKLDREAKVTKGKGPGAWDKRVWGDISGKEVVDVARLADFHLAYFFRRQSDRHAVLVKEKEKVFPGQQTRQHATPAAKRPRQATYEEDDGEDEDDGLPSTSRPRRERKQGGGEDVHIKPDPEDEADAERSLLGSRGPGESGVSFALSDQEEDMEDIKPKFKLKVKYKGFTIFTKSLIIVLEPSPAARARSPDLFLTQQPTERRQLSVTPAIGAGVSTGTLYSHSTSQRRGSRDSRGRREDSTASTSAGGGGGGAVGGSRRDARTGSTPLFRGSMTPSEAGETPEGDTGGFAWSPSPSPVPRSPRRSRPGVAGDGDGDQDQDEGSESGHVTGGGARAGAGAGTEDEPGESAFLLAERILTQDGGAGGAEGRLEGRDDSFGYGFGGTEDD